MMLTFRVAVTVLLTHHSSLYPLIVEQAQASPPCRNLCGPLPGYSAPVRWAMLLNLGRVPRNSCLWVRSESLVLVDKW